MSVIVDLRKPQFKLFVKKLISVKFTCWNEHEENNFCPMKFKGFILKKVYLNLLYGVLCFQFVHDIIFCPYCKRPNKITWMEVD